MMTGQLASSVRDATFRERAGPTVPAEHSNDVDGNGTRGDRGENGAMVSAPGTVAETAALPATIPPFSELSPVERARLAPALEEVTYAEGEQVFAQGAPADALFIMCEGRAQRFVDGVLLDTVKQPALFGDLGLLCGEDRSSTVVAATDCVVWKLPADRFRRLLAGTPSVVARFAASVGGQLTDSRRQVAALAAEVAALSALLSSDLLAAPPGRGALAC